MKKVFVYYMCSIFAIWSICLLKTRQAYTVYKIGNLFPELEQNLFNSSQNLSVIQSPILRAINFASNALENLFLNTYNCHFDLKLYNTKVKNR